MIDAQVRGIGMLTDHHATREDLDAKLLATKNDLEAKIDGTRKDLEAKIAWASNKTILAVIGVNLALAAALRWWPGAT